MCQTTCAGKELRSPPDQRTEDLDTDGPPDTGGMARAQPTALVSQQNKDRPRRVR
jgi:hypothetical protein